MSARCWLETPSGLRVAVSAAGVLIGRSSDCDLVVREPTTSRKHALIRLAAEGPELVPFGKAATFVDDAPVEGPLGLQGGERVRIGGMELRVFVDASLAHRRSWMLSATTGESIPLPPGRFTAGGSLADDVIVPGLEQGFARCVAQPEQLRVRLGQAPERVLEEGDELLLADQVFRLERSDSSGSQDTTRVEGTGLPVLARLSFLPRGGRLKVLVDGSSIELYLSERRCELIALLLQPPGQLGAGEFVPDELLIPRVWGRDGGDRHGLNVLIARVRKDLGSAGLNGYALLERSKAGGATRFALAPGGRAEVD